MSQSYLTQRADRRGQKFAPVNMLELLNAIDAYERSQGGADPVMQDSAVMNALSVLTFAPVSNMPLHPTNWKVALPELDLEVRLTIRGTLVLDALIPENKARRTTNGWEFDDFEQFPVPSRPGAHPRCTCLEFDLEGLEMELRDPASAVDTENCSRRKLLFSSYEFAVRRLSEHFKCSVKTGLVCVGDMSRLYLRKLLATDNPVEYANLLTADKGVRWHGRYLTLCKLEGVSPDELLTFYRSTLARLREGQRPAALAQYLGKVSPAQEELPAWSRQRYSYVDTEPLLGALVVVAHPKAFPPLVDHPSAELEEMLESVLTKDSPHGIDAFARLYWMDEFDVRKMLRDYYPRLLLGELSGPKEILREIQLLMKDAESGAERAPLFLSALGAAIKADWQALEEAGSFSVRMGKLARRCGFDDAFGLQTWATSEAPEISAWLSEVKQLHEQQKAENRAAKKKGKTGKTP